MSRTLKTIHMTLDPESIQKAIDEIEKFRNQLKEAMQELVERLMEDGVEMAKLEVVAMDAIDTGGLEASIGHGAYDPQTHIGVIYAGAYYAVFVEYGTGIVGENNPHPEPDTANAGSGGLIGMMYNGLNAAGEYVGYDSRGHGEEGWVYKSDVDGKFYWTKGMKSRPFMYNTMRYLEGLAERIGLETIRKRVGG